MNDNRKVMVIGGAIMANKKPHYLSPFDLCRLYRINPRDCLMADDDDDIRLKGLDLSKYEIYRPRQDGNYQRIENNEQKI